MEGNAFVKLYSIENENENDSTVLLMCSLKIQISKMLIKIYIFILGNILIILKYFIPIFGVI